MKLDFAPFLYSSLYNHFLLSVLTKKKTDDTFRPFPFVLRSFLHEKKNEMTFDSLHLSLEEGVFRVNGYVVSREKPNHDPKIGPELPFGFCLPSLEVYRAIHQKNGNLKQNTNPKKIANILPVRLAIAKRTNS